MLSVALEHGVSPVSRRLVRKCRCICVCVRRPCRETNHTSFFSSRRPPKPNFGRSWAHGPNVHPIKGSRDTVTTAAVNYCKKNGKSYTSHMLSPYFAEGTKAFAYEVAGKVWPRATRSHSVPGWEKAHYYRRLPKGLESSRNPGKKTTYPSFTASSPGKVMPVGFGPF
ncbi:MAG: hypothetical protein CM1200mP27_11450 [Chloroflexota bacterium]|nr:MAG: hypothetical protein CM1200mP27_11450 [Chloroflexota bacterium]